MATIENERHLRYLLLLGEGGTLILQAILDREINRSGKTLDEILQANKGHFKKDKSHEKLFPPNGIVDKDTWDISLLCTVILHLFGPNLTSDERHDVFTLRHLRDDLAHSASLSKDEQDYNDQRHYVASTLIKLSNGLARPVHDKCQNLIKGFASGPIEIQAATERVRELSRYDEKFSEQLRILTEKVAKVEDVSERLERKVDINTGQLEDIKLLLRHMVQGNASFQTYQELRTGMTLRGPDAGLTNVAEETIVQDFRTALERVRREIDISKVKNAVMNIFDKIEGCDGVNVSGIEQQCVKISMQCRNSIGLLELLEYLQGDVFKERLLDLVLAVEETFNGVFHMTFEIEDDSLNEIRNSLENRKSGLSWQDVVGSDDSPDGQSSTTVQYSDVTETGQLKQVKGSENQLLDVDVAEENAALLDEIIDLLERSDRENAEVIMLIGRGGAGKSAMISTIHKVLTGKYYQIAKQGSGKAQTVTLDLGRYDNCGISLETIKDEDRRQMIEKVLPKLPHIVDCAGLGDEDSLEFREILELLIGGFIPPNTSIAALQSKQEEFGVECLKRIYPKSNPALTVTKVVFVQGCSDVIPRNLIECLTGVLKITDPNTLKRKYTAEVFLLITKYDLVLDPTMHLSKTIDKRSMTLEEFAEFEDAIANELNIVGALESNRIRWASFTDRITGDNQYIDNIALKFLKRMVEPRPPPADTSAPVVGVMKNIDLYMFKLKNQIKMFFLQDMQLSISPALFMVAVVFVVVIAILYKLLSAGV